MSKVWKEKEVVTIFKNTYSATRRLAENSLSKFGSKAIHGNDYVDNELMMPTEAHVAMLDLLRKNKADNVQMRITKGYNEEIFFTFLIATSKHTYPDALEAAKRILQ